MRQRGEPRGWREPPPRRDVPIVSDIDTRLDLLEILELAAPYLVAFIAAIVLGLAAYVWGGDYLTGHVL